MFFEDVVNQGTIQAMDAMLSFTQARHRMLTENIANADTPNYRTKHLDPGAFQEALATAIDDRKASPSGEFRIAASRQVEQDEQGRLVVKPQEEPAENVLFHDGTNVRIEQQMAMLAENAMMHQTVAELLRERYMGLVKAIQGRV